LAVSRGYRIVSYIIVFMAIFAFACGCVTSGFLFNVPTRQNLSSSWVKSPISAQNILRACSALTGSGTICWAFRKSLAQTKRTQSVLQDIVNFTVTRGILLVVIQTVAAVMFEVQPQTLRWMIFHMMLDKIYVITMLAMLNSRAKYRETLAHIVTDSANFICCSLSNTQREKNAPIGGEIIQASHFEPHSEEFQSDAEHGLKSEIDLGSIHSGQVTGILVSQEKITAIDFGNVCTISAKHL